ncbi:MAG: hypothetical protein ACXV5Q_01435 [Frankiaceae bacterium]
MIHALLVATAICAHPTNGTGQFVGLNASQSAHLRYDRAHQLKSYLRCQAIYGPPQGPITVR